MCNFAVLGPLQYLGIAFGGVVLTAAFLFFLLREQKNIQAIDGTLFSSEEACSNASCRESKSVTSANSPF